MIEIKNLRVEDMGNSWTRAVADISFDGMKITYEEDDIWFATRSVNKDMLSDDNYDDFLLVPLYLAMYHRQDLHICGKVSKRLYKNIMTYIQTILCEFSDNLSKVDIIVDGFTDKKSAVGDIVGTGISCGVDSLSTIYDHFIKEDDEDYKINALFFFNCGTHGDYENPKTYELYENRYKINKRAADEMELPVYQVNSNLHAFTHKIDEQKVGYFAIWSCVLALEKAISKYYVSSTYDYEQIKEFRVQAKDFDMAEFCESYLVPLLRMESIELINDVSQYSRTEKTENISEWRVAQKYMNVCINSIDGSNCSKCSKCMRTLIPLDEMGKLDNFCDVFDLNIYRKNAYKNEAFFMANKNGFGFAKEIVNYCNTHGYAMPSIISAKAYTILRKCG